MVRTGISDGINTEIFPVPPGGQQADAAYSQDSLEGMQIILREKV
jgi:hypothetical protein